MDKYKKLFSNTIVFAIGTFSSKILTIILTPFITRFLTTGQYGEMDIIQQTVNVLVPVATLAVNSAALRFAMDKAKDKRAVFSTGVLTTGVGFAIFLCFTPLLSKLTLKDVNIGDYIVIIALFLLSSSTRQLCQQFVRGMGWVRLYAMDGILATFTNLVFNVCLVGIFKWGVNGAVLAIVASDTISILFLTLLGRLYKFIRPRRLKGRTAYDMLKYSIPLVPTAILWLIINISDRYMVTAFLGADANGLYAAASKIPNFVLLFAGIFIDAWQLSAVDEYKSESRAHFFTKVFKIYSGALFAVGSGLILFCQLFTKILVGPDYYTSWQYVPVLIISTIFSCLVNFFASVYMAEKKNTMSMVTALVGAIVNVGLNLWLIPMPGMGANGAALATLASFLTVFVFRAFDTRRFIKINFSVLQLVVDTVLLGVQSALLLFWSERTDASEVWLYVAEAVLTCLMVVINGKPLLAILTLLMEKFLHKKRPGSQPGKRPAERGRSDETRRSARRDPAPERARQSSGYGMEDEFLPPPVRYTQRTAQQRDGSETAFDLPRPARRAHPRAAHTDGADDLAPPRRSVLPEQPEKRERLEQEMPQAFETLSESIYNGEDYLGLGFDINKYQNQALSDPEDTEKPLYQIKYKDDFAGESRQRPLHMPPPAHPIRNKPKNDLYPGKVTEYEEEDETYFGEDSTGFIRKPNRFYHPGPPNSQP